MASLRKTKKIRRKHVNQMIDKIYRYNIPFNYKYGAGYFIFSFGASEYNMHITFPSLHGFRFGIWKLNGRLKFFGEHFAFIDKFKPSASTFTWKSLEEMMEFVKFYSENPQKYGELLCETYEYESMNEFIDYTENIKFKDAHNGFSEDEYNTFVNKFNTIISEIDLNTIDIVYRKSDGYRNTFDVWYFPDKNVTDDWLDELDEKLYSCKCFIFGMRRLPIDYWKHRNKYCLLCTEEVKHLYTDEKRHNRFYRNLK